MLFFKKKEIKSEILKTLNKKNLFKRYFFLVVGCFLLAASFNIFFKPNDIVTGGVSGIAIVFEHLFNIPTETFIAVAYILLLIISYIFLGRKETKYSLIGSILYPLFVFLTKDFANYIQFDVNNMLLVSIFGSVFYGLGSGLTFKYGFSTGGTDIIFQIMSKYLKISIGTSMRITSIIIILTSGFFLGSGDTVYAWETVMYALITLYIISLLNDKVLLGISNSKSFYVITEHETAIKNFLMDELKRGVTVLEARGGYTGDRKKVLMCVIPTKEYYLAKAGILEIDKDAIVLINDVYQSSGIE